MSALPQFFRYIVTGVTSTAFDLIVLHLALRAGLEPVIAVAVAFLAGVGINLAMHKFFTFQERSRLHARQLVRYLLVVALNLLITEAVVWLAIDLAGLSPVQGKLLSLPLVLALGFSLARSWVFARPGRDRQAP